MGHDIYFQRAISNNFILNSFNNKNKYKYDQN